MSRFSLFIFLIFVGCFFNEATDSRSDVETTIEPTPSFIRVLWPEPGSRIALEWYETNLWYDQEVPGICVEFYGEPFLEKGDFLSTEELLERFRLKIDQQEIIMPDFVFLRDSLGWDVMDPETGEILYHVPDGDPFFLCYNASLGTGDHVATFIGRKTSGEELSYNWSFTIIGN